MAAQVMESIQTLHFQLPNGKVGQAYTGQMVCLNTNRLAQLAQLAPTLRVVQLPDMLGLQFDAQTQCFSGTPLVAGEYELHLYWSLDGEYWQPGKCVFIITPDPRSLWKVLEPPADAPFPVPHWAAQTLATPQHQIIAASRRGRSHEHAGSFRDDDFFIAHEASSGWHVMVVADGAGSACYSRLGAKLAANSVGSYLMTQLGAGLGSQLNAALNDWNSDPTAAAQHIGSQFHYLFHQSASLAVQTVEAHATQMAAAPKDFATTLLAAAVQWQAETAFIATFWIGDGAIAACGPRGKVRLMGKPDSGEYAGQTRFLDRASLTDASFSRRIGLGRYTDLYGILLMTDGVSDPRFETANDLADAHQWDALWDDITPCLSAQNAAQSLLEWLHFFTPGHHDDRTLVVLAPTNRTCAT